MKSLLVQKKNRRKYLFKKYQSSTDEGEFHNDIYVKVRSTGKLLKAKIELKATEQLK